MNEEYKCKDCKWLTGQKNVRGIECMNPKLQEKWNKAKTLWMGELRKDTARYKQRNAPVCKKFEAKECKPMSRYIDAEYCEDFFDRWESRVKNADPVTIDVVQNTRTLLRDAPSIDIVRCKECIERDDDWCMYWQNVINADDFCSYGEREGE